MSEGSNLSKSSPVFCIITVYFKRSGRCTVISPCGSGIIWEWGSQAVMGSCSPFSTQPPLSAQCSYRSPGKSRTRSAPHSTAAKNYRCLSCLLVTEGCFSSLTPSFSYILGDEVDHISYTSSLPELLQDKIKWVSQRHSTHFPAFQHFIEDSGSLVCSSMPQIFLWSFI